LQRIRVRYSLKKNIFLKERVQCIFLWSRLVVFAGILKRTFFTVSADKCRRVCIFSNFIFTKIFTYYWWFNCQCFLCFIYKI